MNFENFLVHFQKVRAARTSFVVVTLAQSVGSIPQELGARMIVTNEGLFYGTVGGGAVEKHAIDQAQNFLKEKKILSHFVQWNLQKDLGMSCGGVAGFLFEMHFPESPWQIAVFGAGHVVQELIPILLKLECD
ncbi:MAG: XdhC family protein, partial [Pseudobdellovibrionaceae bacterium]